MNPIFIILINIVISVAITFYFTNNLNNTLENGIRINSDKIFEVDEKLTSFANFLHGDVGENNKEIDEQQTKDINEIKTGFGEYIKDTQANRDLLKQLPEILKDISKDLDNLKNKVGI